MSNKCNDPNKEYILSLSYGKDSIACLEACKQLGYRIDRVVHAEVWATDDIPADLPPMVEFKKYADEVIKERYGLEVEHVCAMRKVATSEREREREYERLTYDRYFHDKPPRKAGCEQFEGCYRGFPIRRNSWCKKLKYGMYFKESDIRVEFPPITQQGDKKGSDLGISDDERKLVYIRPQEERTKFSSSSGKKVVQYLGIAADEPDRIERHTKYETILPLVDIGWDEAYCRKWCEENNLLSPIYTDSMRGGCWFCHNQKTDQLRKLRHNYPDLWKILLKWDEESPVIFSANNHSVHDFDRRFALEDVGLIDSNKKWFKWVTLDYLWDIAIATGKIKEGDNE